LLAPGSSDIKQYQAGIKAGKSVHQIQAAGTIDVQYRPRVFHSGAKTKANK
jgi:hypothetical protein